VFIRLIFHFFFCFFFATSQPHYDGWVSDGAELSDDSDVDECRPRDASLTRAILSIEDIIHGAVPPSPSLPPPDSLEIDPDTSLLDEPEPLELEKPLIAQPRSEFLKKFTVVVRLHQTLKDMHYATDMMAWSKATFGGGFKEAHFELKDGVLT
jgi:hypothetical protein